MACNTSAPHRPARSRTTLTLRRVTKVDITKNTQKEPWYIAINPNGRMCVAYCWHYDGARKFAFDPATQPDEYSEMLQWMFFAHGGIGRKRLVARV
jgi:glutathione S-transferase